MGDDSMAGMDMNSTASAPSGMGMMMSAFIVSTSTPLYSASWAPASVAAYAGTCIFLIILAIVFRALLAAKGALEARWLDRDLARRYVVVAGRDGLAGRLSADSAKRHVVMSENGVEENVTVVQRRGPIAAPWRLSVDPVRAAADVAIAGTGYLLMLAVMTMNVGYFFSVLAGIFVGSLTMGRYASSSSQH